MKHKDHYKESEPALVSETICCIRWMSVTQIIHDTSTLDNAFLFIR